MSLLLALMIAPAVAPPVDPPGQQVIDLQFQIIQFEPEVTRAVPFLKDIPVLGYMFQSRASVEIEASNVEATQNPPRDGGIQPGVTLVADEVLLKAAERAMRLSGASDETSTDTEPEPLPPNWTVLSAPRLVTYSGQKASISVGRTIPYMEKTEDGCLRVVEQESEAQEGIFVEVAAEISDDQTILVKSLNVKVSQITGRLPIADVPFDVGPPIISTRQTDTSFRIAADRVALLRMPRVNPDDPEVMLAVKAKVVENN